MCGCNVYVLKGLRDYEGFEILDIFSNEEAAVKEKIKRESKPRGLSNDAHDDYEVDTFEVK